MNAFRTVGARLSLALLGVVALVLGLVYLIVVPSLKSRLVDTRLNDLSHARNALLAEYERQPNDQDFYSNAAASTNARVLLLAAPLHDALADVDAVQNRMLLAGGLALLLALLVGYAAARLFARRIRRLERAADRIAGGRFDEQVADRSADELGELARAFDRMRIRLAGLDHARREFVANASHELRTPLFSLGGFLELLEDEELDEPTRREFLDTMSGQVHRLTKLADDLLDLSKLDAGRLHLEPPPADLATLAGAAVGEFAGVARASEHPLEYAGDGDVAGRGDP